MTIDKWRKQYPEMFHEDFDANTDSIPEGWDCIVDSLLTVLTFHNKTVKCIKVLGFKIVPGESTFLIPQIIVPEDMKLYTDGLIDMVRALTMILAVEVKPERTDRLFRN